VSRRFLIDYFEGTTALRSNKTLLFLEKYIFGTSMSQPMCTPLRLGLSITAGIVVGIVGFVLLGVSFQVVPLDQYALDYDRNRMIIVPDVILDPGRYALGPGHTLLLFPRTLQNIEFTNETNQFGAPLYARTEEGLRVTLEVSLQYHLSRAQLPSLVSTLGLGYVSVFSSVTRQVVRDVASNFSAFEFFVDRSSIADEIQLQLIDIFNNNLYADVDFFQLRNVFLPNVFESAINQAQVAQQDVSSATFQQQTALVQAQTDQLQAQAQAQVTIKLANSTAQATALQARSEASATNATITALANGYASLQSSLSLGPAEVVALNYVGVLKSKNAARTVVGLTNGALVNVNT
jgi:regulator of protease activity HflC (stomatin/prohibitin superfamily)